MCFPTGQLTDVLVLGKVANAEACAREAVLQLGLPRAAFVHDVQCRIDLSDVVCPRRRIGLVGGGARSGERLGLELKHELGALPVQIRGECNDFWCGRRADSEDKEHKEDGQANKAVEAKLMLVIGRQCAVAR